MPFLPVMPEGENFTTNNPPDFVLVTGDAYVDHPSFGAAVIGRLLASRGFSVGVIAQPDWKSCADFSRFGRPRLAFLVTAGNLDSMVNHYTVALHKRKTDAYSPGGVCGLRPNRATIVYCNRIREAFGDVAIIIGGLEASLRRLAQYDYWDEAGRKSILIDSSADLLVYGMGERQTEEIAQALDSGLKVGELTYIKGTVFKTKDLTCTDNPIILSPFSKIKDSSMQGKKEYARSFMLQMHNADYLTASTLAENYGAGWVVQNPPAEPLTQAELDRVYALPFMRDYHPMYESRGGVPAIEEVKFSITASRGCFGGCHFCALNFHQGRAIQARSHKSVIEEARKFTHDPAFKGYIHDVGAPTANFRRSPCARWEKGKGSDGTAPCRRQCLTPAPCPNLQYDHEEFLQLLRKLRALPGVKKVFIRSGIRYDYVLHDPNGEDFLRELCQHHISGRLKVAPEHSSNKVLGFMGKPSFNMCSKFAQRFAAANKAIGVKNDQFIVPYLMSSHPGCNLDDAIELAEYLQSTNTQVEAVQDFYPTPGTLSTCMYYTGLDSRTMKRIFVAKSSREKAAQRALMQYRVPKNFDIVRNALIRAGRKDLIGHDPRALIRPGGRGKKKGE
jgi:uncharacterized radical SAM protein YgiQ